MDESQRIVVSGSTTTVINRDIPAWRGVGRLVEEASIGAAAGDESQLLGEITSIAVGADRIYLVDLQATKVRAYDMSGAHLLDIGAEGTGPGEFRRPFYAGVRADGNVVVRDQIQRRTHVFRPAGELLDDWPSERGSRTVVADDGSVFVIQEDVFPGDGGNITARVKAYDPSGVEQDWVDFPPRVAPPIIATERRELIELMAVFLGVGADWRTTLWVPFGPRVVAQIAPDGSMISGRADGQGFEMTENDPSSALTAYVFDVQRPDGTMLRVAREWAPVPLQAGEGDWYRQRLTAMWRAATDESWTWLAGDIPATKGAYHSIVPTHDGNFWVVREVAGEPLPGCNDEPEEFYDYERDPCWRQPYIADVFDAEGTFLGEVVLPDRVQYHVTPWIHGDTMIALIEDSEGTAFVKRYRLELPE